MTVCSYHVTYVFQSESTLYSCLDVKELLARNRREIWSLSDCNWIRTHNRLVRKGTLNHLAKLAKWLICIVSTYLYGTLDCMFLSCHVRVSEWIMSPYIVQNSNRGISHFRISCQSLIKENCHNSRASDDIDMKLGIVTKIDRRNRTTSKKFDGDIVSENCDVIVTFFDLWPI